jgi:hypothetical protein
MANTFLFPETLFQELTSPVHPSIEEDPRQKSRAMRSITKHSEPTSNGSPSLPRFLEEDSYRSSTLDTFHNTDFSSRSFLYADKFKGAPVINSTISVSNTPMFSEETQLDLLNDIQYFRGELTKLAEEHRHMVENERVRHGIQTKSLPEIVEERNKTIAELKQQLNDQAFARELLGKGWGKQVLPSRNKIKSSYEDMRKNIMGLPVLDDIHFTADEIRGVKSKDFATLKDRVLGNIGHSSSPNDMAHSLDVWVQSLTGAAVCEWVFKESYQCIAMMHTPLLDGYRQALGILCE